MYFTKMSYKESEEYEIYLATDEETDDVPSILTRRIR